MTFLRNRGIYEFWWIAKMLIAQAHLKRCFNGIHAARTGAESGTGYGFNFARFRSIVAMHGRECRPKRQINVVCALYVHWRAHCGRVCDKRMRWMVCWNDNAGLDWLFAKMVVQYVLLNGFHNVAAKISDDCKVHSCIHQAE